MMPMTPVTSVTPELTNALCGALGFNPRHVRAITIYPGRITVTTFVLDDDGRIQVDYDLPEQRDAEGFLVREATTVDHVISIEPERSPLERMDRAIDRIRSQQFDGPEEDR